MIVNCGGGKQQLIKPEQILKRTLPRRISNQVNSAMSDTEEESQPEQEALEAIANLAMPQWKIDKQSPH